MNDVMRLSNMVGAAMRAGSDIRYPKQFARLNRAYNDALRGHYSAGGLEFNSNLALDGLGDVIVRDTPAHVKAWNAYYLLKQHKDDMTRYKALMKARAEAMRGHYSAGGLEFNSNLALDGLGDVIVPDMPTAPTAPAKPRIKKPKKTRSNPFPDTSAYDAAWDAYYIALNQYKADMMHYKALMKARAQAIKDKAKEDKYAREDARQAAKDAAALAMQQARNQAYLYQSGNYGQNGYGYDPSTGQPYPFTYAYDPANEQFSYPDYQDLSYPDPYAVQASYNAYTPGQYGVTAGDTYNNSYYMPSTEDYYEDYGDYPAQLPQITAMPSGGVRPDVMGDGGYIDSIYADIDSGGIYDTLDGLGGDAINTDGIKTLIAAGGLMLALMYMIPKKGARR